MEGAGLMDTCPLCNREANPNCKAFAVGQRCYTAKELAAIRLRKWRREYQRKYREKGKAA